MSSQSQNKPQLPPPAQNAQTVEGGPTIQVTISRGRNRWTLKMEDSEALDLVAHFRPEESGSLAFERTGWRAVHAAERIVGSNISFTFEGLSPHPDAQP